MLPSPALMRPEQKPHGDPAWCHFNFSSHPRAVLLETIRRLGEEVSWQDSTKELLGHWNNKNARKNILAAKKMGREEVGGKRKIHGGVYSAGEMERNRQVRLEGAGPCCCQLLQAHNFISNMALSPDLSDK